MVVEEIQEGATNPTIPYVGKLGGVAGAVALFMGLLLMKFLEPAADSAASQVSGIVANITGYNPESGTTQDTGGAFD